MLMSYQQPLAPTPGELSSTTLSSTYGIQLKSRDSSSICRAASKPKVSEKATNERNRLPRGHEVGK